MFTAQRLKERREADWLDSRKESIMAFRILLAKLKIVKMPDSMFNSYYLINKYTKPHKYKV